MRLVTVEYWLVTHDGRGPDEEPDRAESVGWLAAEGLHHVTLHWSRVFTLRPGQRASVSMVAIPRGSIISMRDVIAVQPEPPPEILPPRARKARRP